MDAALLRISALPLSYRLVLRDARRALVRRFPYVVVFRITRDQIRVLAVVHQHRDPAVLKRRVG
jgi:plasmid stabilization system protein ParE